MLRSSDLGHVPGWAPIYEKILGILLCLSFLGIAVSSWAHLETLIGVDPNVRVSHFWLVQLLLCALLLPIAGDLVRTRDYRRLAHAPRRMRILLFSLLTYYGLNFYVFLYWSVDHLSSAATWRMISAGWLFLFALAAVYYQSCRNELKIGD